MTFYSHSTQLAQHQSLIEQHWQQCQHGYFEGTRGRLFYTSHVPVGAKYYVVLVNGRIESAWKYQELLWEFAQNNLAVFTFDHIGQGLSERLTRNPHIGYVPQFSDYADDLHLFVEQLVNPHVKGPLFLLAHSMGAAISCDYLARYSPAFEGAFLSAPMLDIQTHNTPYTLAKWAARIACLIGLRKHYAFGQSDYNPVAFADNQLTHCHTRYQRFRALYQKEAELALGGVSFGWLNQAFNFIEKVPSLNIHCPIYIASAEHDEIVDNHAQLNFAKHANVQMRTFKNARHELLCEQDDIRYEVLSAFYAFCEALAFNAKDTGS